LAIYDVNPYVVLGMKNPSSALKKVGEETILWRLLNMEWAQNVVIRSSIGAHRKLLRMTSKTRIIFKLVKFHTHVD